jgi:hypothetical protein
MQLIPQAQQRHCTLRVAHLVLDDGQTAYRLDCALGIRQGRREEQRDTFHLLRFRRLSRVDSNNGCGRVGPLENPQTIDAPAERPPHLHEVDLLNRR